MYRHMYACIYIYVYIQKEREREYFAGDNVEPKIEKCYKKNAMCIKLITKRL